MFFFVIITCWFTQVVASPPLLYQRTYLGTVRACDNISIPTCGGKIHTLCDKDIPVNKECELIEITPDLRERIMGGHNGLRNREAKRHGVQISNMNLLHWDPQLAEMAKKWVMQCKVEEKDSCTYIGRPEFPVSQSIKFRPIYPGEKWLQMVIHDWYKEMSMNMPMRPNRTNVETGFTQMIWPLSQFVGCAAARGLDGTFFVCNYGPSGNYNMTPKGLSEIFILGFPCSNCSEDRRTCSLLYTGLCGVDLDIGYNANQPNYYCITVFILFVWRFV